MNNSTLLMVAGAKKKAKQTIGEQGQLGFGGGLYGGDPADLTAIGLSPLPNNDDPTNENYGSYVHTNGSVMLFIPAFCYRVGGSSAPSYSRDGTNALEIRDASLGEKDGFILHRAFIDGGQTKLGFFFDKYLCSKDSSGKLAISVKNGNPICTSTSYINSSSMPDCSGVIYDAITLSRARGNAYSCATAFQYSAIAMLSLAHGQAAKSTATCAWFDSKYQTNFPKGNNNSLKDIDDSSVTFTQASGNYGSTSLTGSASNLAKTTHTGQVWGVTDINGNKWQPMLGWKNTATGKFWLPKESVAMHTFTKDNRVDESLMELITTDAPDVRRVYWGGNAFYTDASGVNRAMCGVQPKVHQSSASTNIFGSDYIYYNYSSDRVLLASGSYYDGRDAGVWYRNGNSGGWSSDYGSVGFRAGGYAK